MILLNCDMFFLRIEQYEYFFLASGDVAYSGRWREFGILWVYVSMNVLGALGVYWLFKGAKEEEVGKGISG